MGAFYKDARLKIQRADKHIADFTEAMIALEKTCTSTVEYNANGRDLLVHEIPNARESLDNLALITGDAIHNLRTALDFAWVSTIGRLLPDKLSAKTKFPVREKREEVHGALHGIEADSRCRPLYECVMSQIQPYNGGSNFAVWVLHDLDISDKHLLILSLDPIGNIMGIGARSASGELYGAFTLAARGVDGRYVCDIPAGHKIENNGVLAFVVTLQEAGVFKHLSVEGLLSNFKNFTLYTVQLLENL